MLVISDEFDNEWNYFDICKKAIYYNSVVHILQWLQNTIAEYLDILNRSSKIRERLKIVV